MRYRKSCGSLTKGVSVIRNIILERRISLISMSRLTGGDAASSSCRIFVCRCVCETSPSEEELCDDRLGDGGVDPWVVRESGHDGPERRGPWRRLYGLMRVCESPCRRDEDLTCRCFWRVGLAVAGGLVRPWRSFSYRTCRAMVSDAEARFVSFLVAAIASVKENDASMGT